MPAPEKVRPAPVPVIAKVAEVVAACEVRVPKADACEKSEVDEAMVEKKLVVVAWVPMPVVKVKFPMVPMLEKRFVEEAVVEKRVVVVALVPVALLKEKSVKKPEGPVMVAPVSVGFKKVPDSVRALREEPMWSTSLELCLETTGLVSAINISSRSTVELKTGPDW